MDSQIEGYLAINWASSVTACLSSYTLILLSNLVSIDKSVGIGIQEVLYLKNGKVGGGKIAEFNADLISAKKQWL